VNQNQTALRIVESKVSGVRVFYLRNILDSDRGNLTVGEFGLELPFIPKRYFLTYAVPSRTTRGEHAHRLCHQFLISVRGTCSIIVDDGRNREEFHLNDPTMGIYVPPMIWATEYDHSADSTLMVFASERYEPADYIRDYAEFLQLVKDH